MTGAYYGLRTNYNLYLEDGVLAVESLRDRRRFRGRTEHYERLVAEYLFDRGKRGQFLVPRSPPSFVHVWFVGSDDRSWLNPAADSYFRLLADEASQPFRRGYRLFIGAYPDCEYAGTRKVALRVAGWKDNVRRRLADRFRFEETGAVLLRRMWEFYNKHNAPPTQVLNDMHVPFQFYGKPDHGGTTRDA